MKNRLLNLAMLTLVSCASAAANAEVLAIAPTTYGRIYLTSNEGGCTARVGVPNAEWRMLFSTTREGRNTGTGCYTLTDKSVVIRWDDGGVGALSRDAFAFLGDAKAGAP